MQIHFFIFKLFIFTILLQPAVSAFASSNDGAFSTSIAADASCANNISVSLSVSQTANPDESGIHSYTASWTGGSPFCFANEMLTANYNCPSDVVCPTSASISINASEVCSGETVVVLGEYEGEGAAEYTITETSGVIMDIESGVSLNLPENNTCTPQTYTFELSASNCVADGSSVPVGLSNVELTVYPSDISSFISTEENKCLTSINIDAACADNLTVSPGTEQLAEAGTEPGIHEYTVSWEDAGSCISETNINLRYNCDCIFDPALAELELVSGSTQVCFGSSIEYKAKYEGIDRDLAIEGGVDEFYSAAFIIFIEPIDFNQPPRTEEALYRITNDTELKNDENIEPGTYYIYYFQGVDIENPISDQSLCKLYSQGFLVIEILPAISSGESACTGFDNSNEVTIGVTDDYPDSLPYDAYVESNGIQYAYNSIELVDSTKILNFINLPDGDYIFYYEDAQNCSTAAELQLEFSCSSQTYDCPGDVTIEPVAAQCSEATISLTANISGLSEFTTVNWFDEMGNNIEDPDLVMLPLNEACNPLELSYTIEVNCSQNPDFEILSDMVSVIVYPTDISAFVSPLSDACTASVLISDDCDAANLSIESQTFGAGESGTTDVLVSYPENICVDDFTISVAYDCPPEAGCTDPCASNYDADATADDNSCEPYDNTCNEDCTMGALTVWDEATCSCIAGAEIINGCTDAEACNYNAEANCDDGSCQSINCNNNACEGDIEMIDPADACACIVVELQNTGCDDPLAVNYDETVNCSDNSTCEYATIDINISDPCFCENEMNVDLDEDGILDLVADKITINGPANDTWTLTSNGTPPALNAKNVPLPSDGTVKTVETSAGVHTLTVYHPANGAGYGTLTFSSTLGNGDLQISNTDGCNCPQDCTPPTPGNFECDE